MDYYLILYFIAGVFQDFLVTLNYRYIIKKRIVLAALSSFFITIVSMFVLYNILVQLDKERSIVAIIIYAAGIGTGTVFGMKAKIASKDPQ